MRRLRRHVCTKRFFGHIIAGCGVRSTPAAATDLPVAADAALTFQRVSIPHSREVFALIPYIRKLLFEYITAMNGQIPTGKDIPLVADEQDAKPGQTTFGSPAMPASTGNRSTGLWTRFVQTFLPDNALVMGAARDLHLDFTPVV